MTDFIVGLFPDQVLSVNMFVCVKLFLYASVCVGTAGASEKPIVQASQIPGPTFRRGCPSLLPL